MAPRPFGSVADLFTGSLDSYEYFTSSNKVTAGKEGDGKDRENDTESVIGVANKGMHTVKELG